MANINCPKCNKAISQNISHCPYCGYTIKQKDEKYGNMVAIGLGVVLIIFAVAIFTQKKSENNSNSKNNSEYPTNFQEQNTNKGNESPNLEEKQDSQTTSGYENPDDVVGEYADMCPGMTTGTITISKTGSGYLFKETFTGGRKAYIKSLKYENKGGKHYFYIIPSAAGDYYVLEKNGDLSSYDNQGYISYASRKK